MASDSNTNTYNDIAERFLEGLKIAPPNLNVQLPKQTDSDSTSANNNYKGQNAGQYVPPKLYANLHTHIYPINSIDKKDAQKPKKTTDSYIPVGVGKVARATYSTDYYKNANANLRTDMAKLKSSIFIDPYMAARRLLGLIPNRGLYGKLLVLKKTGGKYKILFPPPRSKNFQTLESVETPLNNILAQETYENQEYKDSYNTAFSVWDSMTYTKFLVTSLSIPQREVVSLEQGFGEYWDVHFYGKSPIQLNVGAALLNAYDPVNKRLYAWAEDWYNNYNNFFRGGQVAKQNARTFLILGNYIFSGFILSSTQSLTSNESVVGLGFSMIVVDVTTFSEKAFNMYLDELSKQKKAK